MESWCFDSLEKGYVSNETVSPSDSITVRTKNVLMGWEFKAPFSYENNCSTITTNILAPSQQTIEENPGFSEEGIAEMMRKQFPNDSVKNVLNNTNTNDPSGVDDIMNPSMVTSNAISGEDESSSKLSSSVVDSNSRESSLIDLKLGRFGDNNTKSTSTRTARILSSAESSTPTKRARAASLSSQTAYCQVYGCNKDLSSSKDYHKRHKVCEVHSKTAKVIVNGIEQRFCQQCSRFHLLGEFDDGKRSCRKRLAGHNERRRKPQVGFNSSRTGRSLHSYTAGSIGSKFQGTTPTAASFICQDILGSSGTEKYGANVWSRHIKDEDGVDCAQKSANNGINGQIPQKSIMSPCLFEKQYPPVIDNLNNTGPGSVFGENVNQYPHEIVSRSLFQANSLGSEDVTLFDAASTVQGLPGISESGCALSLLSSQSQNSPSHSSGMHVAQHPGISSSPHYSMSEVSEKLFGVSSQGLTNGAQNSYPSYRVSSTERNHLNAMPGLVNGDTVKSDFGNGILQGSEYMNVKDRLSCEDGTTIDLLQLSSQLHRVENQRQSVSVKQENEGFCRLRMT